MKQRRKTNTRKQAAVSARRSRQTIPAIDIHAHFVPEEYLRLIEAEGEPYGVSLRPGPNGPMIVVGQAVIGPITAQYHNLTPAESNGHGVGVHASSIRRWCTGRMLLGVRLAKIVNDALAEAPGAPDRLWPGNLPKIPGGRH
jgi:hypothetical protein